MNYKNYVRGTLSSNAFVQVNKQLAKRLGFVEAGLLGELIFTDSYAEETGQYFEGGEHGPWFYLTQAKVEENLGIKRREHENAIKNLVKGSIIQKKKMGLPGKNYYLINWENIAKLYDEDGEKEPQTLGTDSLDETYKLERTKRTNKNGRNVQTRLDETYKHSIDKKELEKRDIKTSNKNLVNKDNQFNLDNSLIKDELLELTDEFYIEFATGRWGKEEWFTITDKLATETIDRKVDLTDPAKYIYASLKKIAYNHDFKNGKVDFGEKFKNRKFPHYDWLNAGLEGE